MGPETVSSCSLEGLGTVGSCSPKESETVSSCYLDGPWMVGSWSIEGSDIHWHQERKVSFLWSSGFFMVLPGIGNVQ
uniref:Uncharacterized protein n=1 Tax=Timema douglasi TaxID=61478 RepID=A0A7R8VHY6_TIMDO|nr:unnamed protein product [Timema douglasi]